MVVVSLILLFIAGVLFIPVYVLFVEVIASSLTLTERPPEPLEKEAVQASTVTVIVPAHNESTGIVPTIEDIKRQLSEDDHLLVVADNCTDDTATVAAAAGAEVVARNDPEKIGKGYALDWGVRHLSTNPPDFVIFIDADCRI